MSTRPVHDLPPAVQRRLINGPARLAWIRMNDGRVVDFGGALDAHGVVGLSAGEPLPGDIAWASSVVDPMPVELRAIAAEGGTVERTDVFLWEADEHTFVALVDASTSARIVGANLQRENEGDLLRERLAGSERLRRGERRHRGEALAALGYELLEEGPDGLFRPTAEPAVWLSSLCGWKPGDARVLSPDDPMDFLSSFLGDAAEFLTKRREDDLGSAGSGDPQAASPILSSGVWTEVVLRADGREVDTSFEAHAVAITNGFGLVAVERLDASLEQKQTTLQRQRDAELSFEGLAREVQVKDVLLHCIVHDLRGPLASLVGSLSLLEKGDLDGQERQSLISIGLRQAKRQEEMIREVLDVFAAEYQALRKFEEDPAAAPDLVAIAHETAARQRPAFEIDGVGLTVDAPRGLRRVVGRADRLDRVLANLLGNALRHAPKGSTVHVEVRDASDSACVVSVLDRGPGVPDKFKGQLFKRFVQGGSGGAAGLGLYYVSMTVERWGGRVEYEDRQGGGAAFHVTLRRV